MGSVSRAVEVWLDGQPLSTVCGYSSLGWTTKWPFGDWECTFKAGLQSGWRHPAIEKEMEAEVRYGAGRLFFGNVGDVNRDTGEIYVRGRIRQGENYKAWALDQPGTPTYDPQDALDGALDATGPTLTHAVPIDWKADTLSSTGVGSGDQVMTLLELFELAMQDGSDKFYMGPDGRLKQVPDPTVPTIQVWPKVADLSEALGPDRATRLYVQYLTGPDEWDSSLSYSAGDLVFYADHKWVAVTPTVGTAPSSPDWTDLGAFDPNAMVTVSSTLTPYREENVDARSLGRLTLATATALADAALAAGLEPRYTTDIPLTPLTAANGDGQPINPVLVRAGDLCRVWGTAHPLLGQGFIDVIGGEVVVSDAETLAPTAVLKPYLKPARGYLETMAALAKGLA